MLRTGAPSEPQLSAAELASDALVARHHDGGSGGSTGSGECGRNYGYGRRLQRQRPFSRLSMILGRASGCSTSVCAARWMPRR